MFPDERENIDFGFDVSKHSPQQPAFITTCTGENTHLFFFAACEEPIKNPYSQCQ
jgi:hypothetical protein